MRVDIQKWITDVYISVITIALDRKTLSEKITTLYHTLHYKYILISSQYLLQNFAYNGDLRDLVQSEESCYVPHISFLKSLRKVLDSS